MFLSAPHLTRRFLCTLILGFILTLWFGFHFGDRRGLFAAFLIYFLMLIISYFSRATALNSVTHLKKIGGRSPWMERPEMQGWFVDSIDFYESDDLQSATALALYHPFHRPSVIVSESLLSVLNPGERMALVALLVASIGQKKRVRYTILELTFQNLMWMLEGRGRHALRRVVAQLAVKILHQTAYFLKVDDAAAQLLRDFEIERRSLATALWKIQNLEMTQHRRLSSALQTSMVVDLPDRGRFNKNQESIHFRLKRLVGSSFI